MSCMAYFQTGFPSFCLNCVDDYRPFKEYSMYMTCPHIRKFLA